MLSFLPANTTVCGYGVPSVRAMMDGDRECEAIEGRRKLVLEFWLDLRTRSAP